MLEGPKGKYLFGTVKVGERGQIVIPKEARKVFDIKAGDMLLICGDVNEGGLAVMKSGEFMEFALKILNGDKEEKK